MPARVLFLLTLTLFLGVGCGPSDPGNATAPDVNAPGAGPDILVRVNSVPLTRSDLFTYAGQSGNPMQAGGQGLLDELINLELLRQEAVKQGIDRDPEIRMILANLEKNILAAQVIENKAGSLQFSDAEIQAEYDQQVAALGPTEYRARHILVRTEQEAELLIQRIQTGSDFAVLAQEHSMDTSGEEGGDLGWFNPLQMVAPFAQAVQELEVGGLTREPVQSQFGWHVIRLDETRPVEVPALAEVRAHIEEILQGQALNEYMQALRDNASIEFPLRPEN